MAAKDGLLAAFPNDLSAEYGTSPTGRRDLQRDHGNLHDGAERSRLESDWKLWQDLRKLRPSRRRRTSSPRI